MTFRTYAIALLVGLTMIAALLPTTAWAEITWATFQAEIAALKANIPNLTAEEKNNALAQITYAEKITQSQWESDAYAADDEAERKTRIEVLQRFSNADPAAREEQQKAINQKNSSCNLSVAFDFVECVGKPMATWFGSWFITIGGSILRLAGMVFDALMARVIVDFKNTLENLGVLTIITNSWTFFRDVANILIVGIFVFIAISLILGLKNYGQKKMIARVLIIAVLLNFSLLFAKLIIDASNLVSHTIYTQVAGVQGAGGTSGSVSQKFLDPMKITSVWDSEFVLKEVVSQPGGGALKAFVFGFFGGLLLLMVGLVLFYGAVLIATRAIVLILLMITAPIAFFMYLLPNLDGGVISWKSWWKALLGNAVFAPLLVVFLSISILIVGAASKKTGGATLSSITSGLSTQTLADSWTILMVYLLGVGLLYASFVLSSRLAGSMGGVSFGNIASMLPIAMGTRLLATAAQSRFGGRIAAKAAEKGHEIETERLNAIATKDWSKFAKLNVQKGKLDKKADRTYNPMNTGLGKALAGAAGLSGALAGASKGGFASKMHERAEAAAVLGKAMALSNENKDKIRADAAKEVSAKNEADIAEKRKLLAEAQTNLEQAKNNSNALAPEIARAETTAAGQKEAPEYKDAKSAHEAEVNHKTELAAVHETEIKALREAAAGKTGNDREAAIVQIKTKQVEHATEMSAQDNRIKTAAQTLTTLNDAIDKPIKELQARKEAAEKAVAEHSTAETTLKADIKRIQDTPIKREADALAKQRIDQAEAGVAESRSDLAVKASGTFGGKAGAHMIEHDLGNRFKKVSDVKRLLDRLDKPGSGGEGAAH